MTVIQRFNTGPRMSRAVVHDKTVYLAGVTADDRTADLKGQTEQVLGKIERQLKEAGSDKGSILFAQIWLKHIEAGFPVMNAVWDQWVVPGCTPARATVEANLAVKEILIEIAVTAAVNQDIRVVPPPG